MKIMNVKIILEASKIAECWAFYSALGIEWLAGEDQVSDLKAFTETPNEKGLPELWGKLGNVELLFFRNSKQKSPERGMILQVNIEDQNAMTEVLEKLKVKNVLVLHPQSDVEEGYVRISDPDGRILELSNASYFGT